MREKKKGDHRIRKRVSFNRGVEKRKEKTEKRGRKGWKGKRTRSDLRGRDC